MNPKLIVISGPLEGVIFTLSEGETSIGREVSNQICLANPSVSRHHCSIIRDGDQFQLKDLGSLNSTYVNGVPVKEQKLKSGDRIRVGDSLLLFLPDDEGDTQAANQVQISETKVVAKNTVQLRKEDALRFETGEGVIAAVTPSRSTRDLNALLQISLAVNSARNVETSGKQLLSMIFEIIPAMRGAILLVEDNPEEFVSVIGLHRAANEASPIRVSRTITDRVLSEGAAIFSNDVMQDVAFSGVSSLLTDHIQALMAVPLMVEEKTLGVIYLDTPDPAARFDEHHLRLVRAIAAVASVALQNIRQVNRLENENRRLQAEIAIEHDMIGASPRMREVYKFIAKSAPTNSTVLIRGESGTGKELAARAIHQNSPRADHPFVAINCAALTETLLESELFGHEKGAFTGAVATKKGKLEVAQGGSVFLDEIGEMALTLQAKLLRVLQQHEFERVGGTRPIKADIRLIAATNRNLEQAIKDGGFREDLYYRLNVIRLNMPPLRERREDILPLAMYFAEKYARQCNRQIKGISPQAQACLLKYDWPGNVREIENAIERAVVLGSTDTIQIEDLPEAVIETAPPTGSPSGGVALNFYDAVKEAKKRLILDAFDQAQGNYTEAARLLGMHANHLHRLIRNLDMKAELKK
jgi:Nif-specific regulatory protein